MVSNIGIIRCPITTIVTNIQKNCHVMITGEPNMVTEPIHETAVTIDNSVL
jgi:hypothetical protein